MQQEVLQWKDTMPDWHQHCQVGLHTGDLGASLASREQGEGLPRHVGGPRMCDIPETSTLSL